MRSGNSNGMITDAALPEQEHREIYMAWQDIHREGQRHLNSTHELIMELQQEGVQAAALHLPCFKGHLTCCWSRSLSLGWSRHPLLGVEEMCKKETEGGGEIQGGRCVGEKEPCPYRRLTARGEGEWHRGGEPRMPLMDWRAVDGHTRILRTAMEPKGQSVGRFSGWHRPWHHCLYSQACTDGLMHRLHTGKRGSLSSCAEVSSSSSFLDSEICSLRQSATCSYRLSWKMLFDPIKSLSWSRFTVTESQD